MRTSTSGLAPDISGHMPVNLGLTWLLESGNKPQSLLCLHQFTWKIKGWWPEIHRCSDLSLSPDQREGVFLPEAHGRLLQTLHLWFTGTVSWPLYKIKSKKNLNQALLSYLAWEATCLPEVSHSSQQYHEARAQWKIRNASLLENTPRTQACLHSLCQSTVHCPLHARSPGC